MTTAVAVLDRDEWGSNTDVIVLADRERERLLWVPRDLWSRRLRHRVNKAFVRDGHAGLRAALAEQGFTAHRSICLLPRAIDEALRGLEIEVPVPRPLTFAYPLAPQRPIEEGFKVVRFEPPAERLKGERIHQWLGARFPPEGKPPPKKPGEPLAWPPGDFLRIERQQTLVGALLGARFDFARLLSRPDLVSLSGKGAIDDLAFVDAAWRMTVVDRVEYAVRDGMSVLVR